MWQVLNKCESPCPRASEIDTQDGPCHGVIPQSREVTGGPKRSFSSRIARFSINQGLEASTPLVHRCESEHFGCKGRNPTHWLQESGNSLTKLGSARKQALLRLRIYMVVFNLSFSLHASTLFVSALLCSRLTLSAEQAQSEEISLSLFQYLNINQRKGSDPAWIILPLLSQSQIARLTGSVPTQGPDKEA